MLEPDSLFIWFKASCDYWKTEDVFKLITNLSSCFQWEQGYACLTDVYC